MRTIILLLTAMVIVNGCGGGITSSNHLSMQKTKTWDVCEPSTIRYNPQEYVDSVNRSPYAPTGGIGNKYDAPIYNDEVFPNMTSSHTSTFSVDVDTASYTTARRIVLTKGKLPPAGSVRAEEFINYFTYIDSAPYYNNVEPFNLNTEIAQCPWNPEHKLLRINLKAKELSRKDRLPCNLVFLIDVSGSMDSDDKLGLVKYGLNRLIKKLDRRDKVSIVTYAGSSKVVLDSIPGDENWKIRRAIRTLNSGGSTNGSAGIKDAYAIARKNFIQMGNNRVILCTDGDFNVGVTDRNELNSLIKAGAGSDIYLTALGFGTGNHNDGDMEDITNKGNGNYYYIDSQKEAERVLSNRVAGTITTVAKDTKIQIFFNPKIIKYSRLVGYENRVLANADFNNDQADAGDIGAGHSVTALYEIGYHTPHRAKVDDNPFTDPSYGKKLIETAQNTENPPILRLRVRYKNPGSETSILKEEEVYDNLYSNYGSDNLRWGAAVSWYAMLLKGSPYLRNKDITSIINLAKSALEQGNKTEREEFMKMLIKSRDIINNNDLL